MIPRGQDLGCRFVQLTMLPRPIGPASEGAMPIGTQIVQRVKLRLQKCDRSLFACRANKADDAECASLQFRGNCKLIIKAGQQGSHRPLACPSIDATERHAAQSV